VGSGYDSLTMTSKGFIIEHTFSTQSWSNPFYPNYTYIVPDTLHLWDNSDSMANYTDVSLSSSAFQQSLETRVQGAGNLGFGVFSTDMYVYQDYEKHQYVQSTNMRSTSWYDLELSPIVRIIFMNHLTPVAKSLLGNLGQDITDPVVKQQYWMALSMLGDSLITRVSMGGRLYYKGFLKNDTVNNITAERFQDESGLSFFGLFGSESAYDLYQQEVSETIKEELKVEVRAEGGFWTPDESLGLKMTPTGFYKFALKDIKENILDWDSYVVSVKDNLAPVRYQIIPLYQLFTDPVISNNLKLVTQEYIKSRINRMS